MDKDLDTLLNTPLLAPPEDFTQRVMQQIHYLPLPARSTRGLRRLQWLAFISGGVLGLAQLAAFMFGIWAAGSAG